MGRKSMADQRRSEIIDAFYRCVVREGFSGASIRKVAQEANVKPSILHHYFQNRDEMIETLVAHYTDMIFEYFNKKMRPYKDPEERLAHALRFLFGPGMIGDEVTGVFLEFMVEARHNPRVRKTLATTFRRFRAAIIDFIDDIETFKVLPGGTKNAYASMIIAMHEGMEIQWFANPRDVSLKKAADIARMFIEMLATQKGGK